MLLAHLTEAPTPVSEVRERLPLPLAQLIMRCLEKKAADRPQSADEILAVLEALATPTATQPVNAVHRWRMTAAVAGAAIMVVAVAILASQLFRSKPLAITVSNVTPVTTEPGVEFQPAISPDGQVVAYVAGPINIPHLVIRATANVAGGGEARLADSSLLREWYPAWSGDGNLVRFRACREAGCAWEETGSLGGAVRSVPLPHRARTVSVAAWSPDDSRVAFVVGDTIFTSSAAGTVPRLVAVQPAPAVGLHSLAWSPDGALLAYVNGNMWWRTFGNLAPSSIWVVNTRGGTPQPVTTAADLNGSPAWLDAHHLLFVSDRDGLRGVYVVEVGPHGSRGEPRAVSGVLDPHSISYSIGAHKLAYSRFTHRQNIWAYPLGRPGQTRLDPGRPAGNERQPGDRGARRLSGRPVAGLRQRCPRHEGSVQDPSCGRGRGRTDGPPGPRGRSEMVAGRPRDRIPLLRLGSR